ncbi:twitching motility protein PilT [Pseudobutyrivibrio sp. ACV-2]|uniref:type IV pilus twitching motility protein PilT n=1 Tax=Pseudobutyrivibrio sp. ACV-2 TaxID=1520801 RepID=UPI0008978C6D|nr:PilT/PilU family type 4a pilus ATPase [Pseudobutyrivibrio sp. ACV-2]SEA11731.1 twitching motility protein PilT [Pseudobutyrivibrio sp. ACV-2]
MAIDIVTYLTDAVKKYRASDVFIITGREVSFRVNDLVMTRSELEESCIIKSEPDDGPVMPAKANELVEQIYELAKRDPTHYRETGDDDFSFAIKNVSRFRVNAFKQRGTYAAVVRVITFSLPDYQQLKIPEAVINLANESKGLVLVTGPAGSGKSTTLSCIVDKINKNYNKHIITLEDPVEYLHKHNKSIVSQREIHLDTENYVTALRASLRQSPDVILLGEMRDAETISVAMTAAETGHLILSTLHTIGAANTIDRIIDVFPSEQQHQIALQLSMVIKAVVSQQLVPSFDGRLVPAFEVMTVTPAIRNMIRENKVPQIEGVIYSSDTNEMISMDSSLYKLVKDGTIDRDVAMEFAVNPEMLGRRLGV